MKSWFQPGSAFNEQENTQALSLNIILAPFSLIVLIWLVYWLDFRLDLDLYRWGILPREWKGLVGVLASPLIHGSLEHVVNNSIPLLILGAALYYFYPKPATTVILVSWVSSGIAVWLLARESFHIGASGVVYALAGFIFVSGLLRGKANLLALSLLVVFIYGGLFWGMLPFEEGLGGRNISYEGHAAGAASGLALALIYRKTNPRQAQIINREDYWENDDLSEQIEKFGEDYWKDYAGQKSDSQIKYHYKPTNPETEQ